MDKNRKAYIESCEVSFMDEAALGGFKQKFVLEGKKKDLPIVLCLHGGPGSPVPFSIACRGLFPEFTDKFIMVYWDQLGCGKNNYPIDNNFKVQNFVDMTVDLVKLLKSRYPDNKLYLFGMSWGSILAVQTAVQIPEMIDGVVSCGQVLTAPSLFDSTFDAIETSSAPKKYKKFVENLRSNRENCTTKDLLKLSKIIRKYTNGYNNKNAESAPVGKIIKGMLTSPDYRLKDFMAVVKNGYAKNESLINEMLHTDLRDLLSAVTVPYKIFQGETDIVTSTKDVKEFIDTCGNDNISCTIIPDTGHFPSVDAMNKIFDCFCEISS